MKHLIKNNQILQSGIPSNFIRASGEEFWGGYENMITLHYEDGWRDEILPSYDGTTQTLGEKYYDIENDIVKYKIADRVIDLQVEKEGLLRQLSSLRREIANVITDIRLLHDPEPELLTQMTPMIRGLYTYAKEEIDNLTVENITSYTLKGPQVQQLLQTLNSML